MHVKKGRFYGPSRGRAKTQNMARPSAPFEILFSDPPTIAALKNNFNGILTKIGDEVCCSNLRMYVMEGALGGGTNSYPCCSYRNDACLLQKQITAPEAIGHGAIDDLPRQDYVSVASWLSAAKQHNATLPEAEQAPMAKIRFAAYGVLSKWKGVTGRV